MSIKLIRMAYPWDIRIQITARCNLYCDHCFASANEKPPKDELSDKEFLQVIDDITRPEVKAISITGGEPLVRKELVLKILKAVQDKPITTTLNTNGWLLSRELASKLGEVGLDRVQISLDSSEAEKHDTFRGAEGSHTRALKAIENSARAGIASFARVTITPFNYSDMPEILGLVKDKNASGLIVKPLVPSGRAESIKDPLGHKEHKIAVTSLINEIEENPSIERGFVQFLSPSFPFLIDERYAIDSECCECGEGLAFISANGDVQPCGYTHFILGNLMEQSLENIWSTAPFLLEWREKRQMGKCQSCEYVDICKGGCRAAAYETTGTLDVSDPLCWR